MEQPIPTSRRYTVAEYLAFEDASESKHEYRDGEVIDMAGALETHIKIQSNLNRRIGENLDGSNCDTRGSDQRVRTDPARYCYPDQTIVCGVAEYDPPESKMVLTNPSVIFEIMSESSETSDRGEKFTRYRGIESLNEYILIAQDKAQVETYYRQVDGVWAIGGIVQGLDATLQLRSVPVQIRLADLFAGVTFPSAPAAETTK